MWDTIKRYDGYISTVNFRCGLIASFSAAVFGGVILKADALLLGAPSAKYLLASLLVALGLLSLLSIYWVVRTIWPDLTSNVSGSNDPSLFFFESVANKFDASSYYDKQNKRTIDEFEKDLAIQVHEVARVTSLKFRVVSKAANCVKWSLAVMAAIICLVVVNSLGVTLCLR
jgi:hypothetical protein